MNAPTTGAVPFARAAISERPSFVCAHRRTERHLKTENSDGTTLTRTLSIKYTFIYGFARYSERRIIFVSFSRHCYLFERRRGKGEKKSTNGFYCSVLVFSSHFSPITARDNKKQSIYIYDGTC